MDCRAGARGGGDRRDRPRDSLEELSARPPGAAADPGQARHRERERLSRRDGVRPGPSLGVDGKLKNATTQVADLGANGGIVSDAADEARFLTALMQGQLLRPAELAELKTPSPYSNYGLGTGIDASGCAGTAYGHNGGGAGFSASVFVSGDGKRVAVLLLNGRTADGHGDAVMTAAMNELYCAG